MTRPRTDAEVEARIEAWHRGDDDRALHDGIGGRSIYAALGWTWQEYARWVETGELPEDCREEVEP